MSAIKTLGKAIGVSGIVATAGMVYTHDQEMKVKTEVINKQMEAKRTDQAIEIDKLELEKYKLNLPSIYNQTPPPNTPEVVENLPSPVNEIFKTSSPIEFDLALTQTTNLGGLAIIFFSLGLTLTIFALYLNFATQRYGEDRYSTRFPKLYEFHQTYLKATNKLLVLTITFYLGMLLFVGCYLLLI